jgi:hypothetical protein
MDEGIWECPTIRSCGHAKPAEHKLDVAVQAHAKGCYEHGNEKTYGGDGSGSVHEPVP